MVLLTSSAISVFISSSIVFLFTFLLFLSGYVLQQQTVRSLQEALQAPVEVRLKVQSGLRSQFEVAADVLVPLDEVEDADSKWKEEQEVNNTEKKGRVREVTVQAVFDGSTPQESAQSISTEREVTPQQLWYAYVDSSRISPDSVVTPNTDVDINLAPPQIDDTYDMRLAYVLSLSSPSDLCSALLFTKWHRESSGYPHSQFNIIYLYPSDWENSAKQIHRDALDLLIRAEHQYSVLLHPVQISKVWTGIDVESQLLSELARNPWIYDRVMYLRSPGMLLDTNRLDDIFVSSYTDPTVVKTQWTKLKAPVRRGADRTALHPDILLFAQGRGLMIPSGGLAKTVTGKASGPKETGRIDEHGTVEGLNRNAAYVLFDRIELDNGQISKSNGLLERFEQERQTICEATRLLS